MLFILVFPHLYLVGSLLTIVGVTCLGSSFVLLNSFLPLLVTNHPSLTKFKTLNFEEADHESSRTSLLTESEGSDLELTQKNLSSEKHSSEIQLSTKISSKGVGLGYCAAVSVQCISIGILSILSKTSLPQISPSMPLRVVLFMVGLCWACGTIPAVWWLRHRPGPPLMSQSGIVSSTLQSLLSQVSFAWKSLWRTFKVAAKLREVRVFLLAWFLLSDAIATVSATAILFARTELQMGTVAIAILSITATASGIAGAFSWPRLSGRFALDTNHTIVACVLMMEIIPIYGLLGFLPFIQAWGVGGLQKPWEIFPLAVIHGFVMGGLSSYCRSFFGNLIPPGHEAAFYALFAITDKGSSAIGPAVVGAIVDATGQIRPAFGFLLVLIAIPAPLVWFVDAEKGRKDALTMAEKSENSGLDTYDLTDRAAYDEQDEGLLNG